jgi:hypothetical protein
MMMMKLKLISINNFKDNCSILEYIDTLGGGNNISRIFQLRQQATNQDAGDKGLEGRRLFTNHTTLEDKNFNPLKQKLV